MSPSKTVFRKDAEFEPPWMGLRRVFDGDTQSMSRCQCLRLKPLFTTGMNRRCLAEHAVNPSMGARHPHATTTDGGSAGFAGAKNLPCG